ncbi:UDP-N-acetylmuramoyl-tripeptide--D-alanyl-D-alanine ligase [Bacterioplanes sanyensis]|uniref:UDP-N-acetylmuramoyl-tripeptide--D-alanyl-D- alanine ligase n=1 Tax=Bacterioplanes sanyensis TaxID=1249553 RepID=UPI001673F19B|nr:UDP-N-acetylmuramoyl-tripeptide--D-alanyl-D-alanine ligase [Bacterioplanes sanyensis]GGY37790.1 UDP-N-acetylmuramoyl-tripeptide--D-alanyl-D-alanine ligase [Bacterioplanes sanyensis]
MMYELLLPQVADIMNADMLGPENYRLITRVSTDTRSLQPGDLYVALRGERFDGHAFAAQALQQGAVAVVVDHPLEVSGPQLLVNDTLEALSRLAAWRRREFEGPVVGITGSSGKTTVKQLMASVLEQRYRTWMTQGNLNNHIGVPLTLLGLSPEYKAAVIEMGASGVGEIDATARLVKPSVAILTNASDSHLQGFGSLQGVVSTKGELLDHISEWGTAVLNADDPHFDDWQWRARDREILSFGLSEEADVSARDIHTSLDGVQFTLQTPDFSCAIQLPLLGRHNVLNALAVAAAAIAVGLNQEEIRQGLNSAQAFDGRLQWHRGQGGIRLLDDSYNANPASVRAAIDVLADAERGWLVLGDMGELGEQALAAHQNIGAYAKQRGIHALLGCGELSKAAVAAMDSDASQHFNSQTELLTYLQQHTQAGDVVLVKGSRSAAMDQVVRALQLGDEDN